jgi:hypothetical protein
MKIKTSELQGAALDWAVAKCEDWPMDIWYDEDQMPMIRDDEVPEWKPSTDWSQGGPIVEREKMGLHRGDGTWGVAEGKWEASHPECLYVEHGATPLIAAMRCYVASKLGDEVEVPDELHTV